GVSGEKLGLSQLPDGIFQPPMELNCVENELRQSMETEFEDGRVLTPGRVAHITEKTTKFEGRGTCQYRNRCWRGCPFGGYFSSNAVTLPAAERTGNLTLRPNSIVHEVVYDEETKLASGVKIIDAQTQEKIIFKGKIVFLCASAMASVGILLQSKSDSFPNGMGNNHDQLGRNIMDHHYQLGASALVEGHLDKYYKGRRPNGFYIPRFVNLDASSQREDFIRGFGYQGGAGRGRWQESIAEMGYGKAFKESILKPGHWEIGMSGFGEMLPHPENKVTLSTTEKDKWGLPQLDFDVEFKTNERNMRKAIIEEAVSMFTKAGFKNVTPYENSTGPGLGIHEMGGARMGSNSKTSVVDRNNSLHDVKNVFVTDGAFMTSASCVNPSLTYMAFTARAANFAAQAFKNQNFS
ncbi:MAG: GMC family oxidoreductase, partial [Bacteroidota bacterium]